MDAPPLELDGPVTPADLDGLAALLLDPFVMSDEASREWLSRRQVFEEDRRGKRPRRPADRRAGQPA